MIYERLVGKRKATYFCYYHRDANATFGPHPVALIAPGEKNCFLRSGDNGSTIAYRIRALDTERTRCWCPHEFVLSAIGKLSDFDKLHRTFKFDLSNDGCDNS